MYGPPNPPNVMHLSELLIWKIFPNDRETKKALILLTPSTM